MEYSTYKNTLFQNLAALIRRLLYWHSGKSKEETLELNNTNLLLQC